MVRVRLYPTGDTALLDLSRFVQMTEKEYTRHADGEKLPVVELFTADGHLTVVLDPARTFLSEAESRLNPPPLLRSPTAAEAEHARRQAIALAGPRRTCLLPTGKPVVWTDEEAYKLNAYQHDPSCHPYTCGEDSRHRPLIATTRGWFCADCGYHQSWYAAPPAPKAA